ncbi:MAG TPA: hypothetical protein VIU63_10250 [Nitrospira sp.]
MNGFRLITIAGIFAVAVGTIPVNVVAGSRDDDRRGSHQLIDRQRIEHLIAELKKEEHHLKPQGDQKLTDLQNQVATLTASNASLVTQLQAALSQLTTLQSRVSTLESNSGNGSGSGLAALAQYVTIDPNPINGLAGPHVIFTGVNVHVRSGSGFSDNTRAPNSGSFAGLGNLVMGYNESPTAPAVATRTGSHNIVGGTANSFSSFGGLVLGRQNTIAGKFATILGGSQNEADGDSSSILGGRSIIVSGFTEHNP